MLNGNVLTPEHQINGADRQLKKHVSFKRWDISTNQKGGSFSVAPMFSNPPNGEIIVGRNCQIMDPW